MKSISLMTLLAVLPCGTASAQIGFLPETSGSSVGFPTVAAALDALHSNGSVIFSRWHGWTIAKDTADKTVWSFAPERHPAAPAVVKRHVYEDGGQIKLQTSVLCGGSKVECDRLVVDFYKLNAAMFPSVDK